MKLLTRTTLYFIPVTLLVLAIGGWVFFYSLQSATKDDADERLNTGRDKVMSFVKAHGDIPAFSIGFGDSTSFKMITSPLKGERINDTTLYNVSEKEYEPYRMIEFPLSVGGKNYSATIFKPLIESDDLREAIIKSLAIMAIILLVVFTTFNFVIAKTTWKPFYSSLGKLKSFDLANGEQISFDKTNTNEFSELNEVLSAMTNKISTDYRSLKEFTENASHELQTPLSVIQSKLELLIQSDNLSPEQVNNVKAIYESATKLSKLNQALLLLAKIENRQFGEVKEIALHELVENKLKYLSELIGHKRLSVNKQISPLVIKAHPVLADILVVNLISNAIKHNVEGGKLGVEIGNRRMTITNSAPALSGSTDDLFARFKKANPSSDSLGLGLAIVKEICSVYGFQIRYDYLDGMHRLSVAF